MIVDFEAAYGVKVRYRLKPFLQIRKTRKQTPCQQSTSIAKENNPYIPGLFFDGKDSAYKAANGLNCPGHSPVPWTVLGSSGTLLGIWAKPNPKNAKRSRKRAQIFRATLGEIQGFHLNLETMGGNL